jgi:hypothetical protein
MMEFLRFWSSRAAIALLVFLLAMGLAYSFPADVAFLFAIDLATWVEAVVVVYAAAQVTKIRPLLALLAARLIRRRYVRKRPARMRRLSALRDAANDDLNEPDRALAA